MVDQRQCVPDDVASSVPYTSHCTANLIWSASRAGEHCNLGDGPIKKIRYAYHASALGSVDKISKIGERVHGHRDIRNTYPGKKCQIQDWQCGIVASKQNPGYDPEQRIHEEFESEEEERAAKYCELWKSEALQKRHPARNWTGYVQIPSSKILFLKGAKAIAGVVTLM